MEGLIVRQILPPELRELDAQELLQATNLPDLDELLSQVPNPEDIEVEPRKHNGDACGKASSATCISTRFGNPVGDDEVKGSAVPANTLKSTVDGFHHLIGLRICLFAQKLRSLPRMATREETRASA